MSTQNLQSAGEYATETFLKIGKLLYLSENYADFHFVFKSPDGQIETVPVHKTVLAQGSKVFGAMFSDSWKEKRDGTVNASASAFKEFLQIFYLASTKLTMDNVVEVMELGKMYDVSECFAICAEFLKENLNGDNACWVYEWVVRLEHKELEAACHTEFEHNTKAVLTSDSFLHCDRKTVQHILQMDPLRCLEVECFQALMNWMKTKCRRDDLSAEIVRNQFVDLIHEIRFGSMSLAEFNAVDSLWDALFTADEYREIMKMMECTKFEPKIFKGNRRGKFELNSWNNGACIYFSRLRELSTNRYYISESEIMKFTVTTSVLFGPFYCLQLHSASSPMKSIRTEFTVSGIPNNSDEKVILYTGESELSFQGVSAMHLSKPIFIQPGYMYEIQLKQSLPLPKIYTLGFDTRSKDTMKGITVYFHEDPTVNSEKGLISTISLNEMKNL